MKLKKWKNLVGLFVGVLMICVSSIKVSAAEMQEETNVEHLIMIPNEVESENDGETAVRALLYNCIMSVYCSSQGMEIAFSTDCVQLSSVIGVKDIVIKQKVWYGWKTVATSVGGYYTNEYGYTGTILYTNAVKGETYRITCTHYADADNYSEVDGEMELIFTY